MGNVADRAPTYGRESPPSKFRRQRPMDWLPISRLIGLLIVLGAALALYFFQVPPLEILAFAAWGCTAIAVVHWRPGTPISAALLGAWALVGIFVCFLYLGKLPIGTLLALSLLFILIVLVGDFLNILLFLFRGRASRFTAAALLWICSSSIMITIIIYAMIYENTGLYDSISQVDVDDRYSCLYFSIITWTNLGYGDIVPKQSARFFAASESVLGYFMMALLIAAILQAFQSLTNGPRRPS
jgi:hypothetical protein